MFKLCQKISQEEGFFSTIYKYIFNEDSQTTSIPETMNSQVSQVMPESGLPMVVSYIPDESNQIEDDYEEDEIQVETEDMSDENFFDETFYEPVHRGLSAEQMDLVPKVTINDSMLQEEGFRTNFICTEDFVAEEVVNKLGCSHRFHLPCLKKWLFFFEDPSLRESFEGRIKVYV